MAISPSSFYGILTKSSQLVADSEAAPTLPTEGSELTSKPPGKSLTEKPKTPPNAPIALPKTTPISNKMSGTQTFSSEFHLAEKKRMDLARESSGQFLGGMHAARFLETFLPLDKCESTLPRPRHNARTFARVASASSEAEMYTPFITAVTPFAPKLTFVDTHSYKDPKCDLSPDIGGYEKSVFETIGSRECKTDLSRMEVPVELKCKVEMDPFIDPPVMTTDGDPVELPKGTEENPFPFERDSTKANLTRGQVTAYGAALTGLQFRTHAFLVLICGNTARLIRWDRSGAVVSRAFNYLEKDYLVEFFWRHSHSRFGADGRGHDDTVMPCTRSDEKSTANKVDAMKQMKEANEHHREFRTMLIPDRDDPEQASRFIISYPPKYVTPSPFGRATRPMLAFDIEQDKLVFVKDYWRAKEMHKEGDIYKILKDSEVPYIATFGRGNDVHDVADKILHVTRTDTLRSEKWALPTTSMVPLHHYRMSLNEVGRHLTEFESTHELGTAIADAMEAHECAFHDARILHRDISVGNIIITDEGRGMLIDWDLCANVDNPRPQARRPERTGTWQFMSAALLKDRTLPQDVLDDRESSFYVLVWDVLTHSKHNRLKNLSVYLKPYDEAFEGENGTTGGSGKKGFLLEGFTDLTFHPQLDKLIEELRHTFVVRYEKAPTEDILEMLSSPALANSPTNYVVRKKNLENRHWLVETFRRHLQLGEWPKADRAMPNDVTAGANKKKRTQHEASLLEKRPSTFKSQRLMSGSGANRFRDEDVGEGDGDGEVEGDEGKNENGDK